MAKRVWLIRHARQNLEKNGDVWQVNARLASGSVDRVLIAAEYFRSLGVEFAAFHYSPLIRSRQTCLLLKRIMNIKARARLSERLGPGEVSEWNKRFKAWKADNPQWGSITCGPSYWSSLWPDLCRQEARRAMFAITRIAAGLVEGEDAAAIGHNPLIRLAEGLVVGSVRDPDLAYCQAVCFTFHGKEIINCTAHLF